MTHTEALDNLLSMACPAGFMGPNEDEPCFIIDLHCVQVEVHARLVSTVNSAQYEIVSVTVLSA